MQTHVSIGRSILSGSRSPLLQMAEQIASTHHEWWDGSGYMWKLAGGADPCGSAGSSRSPTSSTL